MNEIQDFSGDATILLLCGFATYLFLNYGGAAYIAAFIPKDIESKNHAWRVHGDVLQAYIYLFLFTVGMFLFTPLNLGEAVCGAFSLYIFVFLVKPPPVSE